MKRKKRGKLGEKLALKHLRNSGYQLLEQNFQTRFGEIDFVTLKDNILVFIEVKTGRTSSFIPVEEMIRPSQTYRLAKLAQEYQQCHPQLPDSFRLDAVLVKLSPQDKLEEIRIVENLSL